jgi:ArsR family transcriptional regulator
MRICIPTEGDEGLGAQVAGHLGRAPFLTLIDTDAGAIEVLANPPHAHGRCQPAKPLEGRGVEAVICGGAGRGAVAALEAAGIRVMLTGSHSVEQVLGEIRQGSLRVLGAADACAGHHGAHEHGGGACRRHA